MMICQICGEERKTQCSHDIPKYIGGTDKDGRHNLCLDCHKNYDEKLLRLFLKFIDYKIDHYLEWTEVMELQKSIAGLKNLHYKFKEIAFKIKEEVFRDGDSFS